MLSNARPGRRDERPGPRRHLALGATRTDELAVMWDTFPPSRLTTLWQDHDNPEYAYSWNPRPDGARDRQPREWANLVLARMRAAPDLAVDGDIAQAEEQLSSI